MPFKQKEGKRTMMWFSRLKFVVIAGICVLGYATPQIASAVPFFMWCFSRRLSGCGRRQP